MIISKLNPSEQQVVRHSIGLTNYLKSLEEGRSATPRSWLYENKDPKKVYDEWLSLLTEKLPKEERGDEIYQFELKQVEKFGPQGKIPGIKEAIKVESFQEQYFHNKKVSLPLRPLSSILQSTHLQYWDISAVYDSMSSRDTLNTNSGWPQFRRRSTVRSISEQYALSGAWMTYPAIILFRHYNGKLRVVWMYPMSANLAEYRSTIPIQNFIKDRTKYVTPWLGFESVKARFTQLWSAHPYAFGGDTTAMDAHMQLSQLQQVGLMCQDLFVDPHLMLDTLLHVANINLVVGIDSIIRDQQHGIASGSGWTQLSETIFQIGMFDKYLYETGQNGNVDNGMGIGDDYVWFFDRQQSSDEIVKFWDLNGLPGKPEKQSNDPEKCTFLQRLFLKGLSSREDSRILGGIYPTLRALNSLIYPEKFVEPKRMEQLGIKYSDVFCCRTFMILENTVDHPLFEEFCRYVVSGHKDLLPFAKSQENKINELFSKTRQIPGVNPSYNQEKMTRPLSEFASIKYVRSL